jgi:hypothetical protein
LDCKLPSRMKREAQEPTQCSAQLPASKETNLYSEACAVGTRRVALKYGRSAVVGGEKIRTVRKEHKDVEAKASKTADGQITVDGKVGYFVWTVSHVEEEGKRYCTPRFQRVAVWPRVSARFQNVIQSFVGSLVQGNPLFGQQEEGILSRWI